MKKEKEIDIKKEDIIVFLGDYGYSEAVRPKDSFFELSEKKQKELLKKYAEGYSLPMSMGKGISVFKAQRLLSVCDEEKIKEEFKKTCRDEVKKKFEEKLEIIDKW